ncbi:MAG: Sec-independent protein translocase subunit TatB [Corynebacteriales bacterium]|nr:Sec-independent protein translocase subunit TatB [Mycobacteriales bacterium]
MFENLGWWEIGLLLVIALIIFGPDRLPELVRDALGLLRKVRGMAREASSGLREQLGPDVELEDLHPKKFVQKHLFSDDDLEDLRRPFTDVAREINDPMPRQRSVEAKPAEKPRFDPDAT